MTPADLNRRRRLLRVRAIAERLAQADRAQRMDASSSAQRLAGRLDDEAALCAPGVGTITGASLAAHIALAARIRSAQQTIVVRRQTLAADLARSDAAMHAARRATRSAELLVERGAVAAEAADERRSAVPHRRRMRL